MNKAEAEKLEILERKILRKIFSREETGRYVGKTTKCGCKGAVRG